MSIFKDILSEWNIHIDDHQSALFDKYFELLVSWNEKFNLTAITEKEDVFIKHFSDSLALMHYMDLSGRSLIDIGTGAGFPGIPLKIMNDSCRIVLMDSLNKRISFLDEVINELGLSDIRTVHGRAEDIARTDLRESFDIATSRAVANLSTLSEYCIPFVKTGGVFVSYKGGDCITELEDSKNAVSVLGGNVSSVERYIIPGTDYERTLIFINKLNPVGDRYPRKAGVPNRKPL